MSGLTSPSDRMNGRSEFDRCWPLLEPAVGTPATHSKEDVWATIEDRRAVFWPMTNAAIVGNILTAPTGLRSGNLWLAGGDWSEIAQFIRPLEAYAQNRGCHRAIFRGRPGFERVMKSYGYRVLGVQMVKDF